jgi:uncharacterized protein (DUF362 family)
VANDDSPRHLSRRSFLSWTAGAITTALAASCGTTETSNLFAPKPDGGTPGGSGGSLDEAGSPEAGLDGADDGGDGSDGAVSDSAVAIVRCTSYDAQAQHDALAQAFDLLGGIDALVKGKVVTIKPNLTGTPGGARPGPSDWPSGLLGHTAGETYITHGATALALTSLLLKAGAKKVRIVESPLSLLDIESVLDAAGWDVTALKALGNVEFEATRNLGNGTKYAQLNVPGGGLLYEYFMVNHSYVETDVFISLAKMKEHDVTGVTLSMKNLFGITPNAIYGQDANQNGEDAVGGRMVVHDRSLDINLALPGEKPGFETQAARFRMPRVVADLAAARPIHLAIVEAVMTERGGEGPWEAPAIRFTTPGLLIVGRNPVSTDAVAVATMGYPDPLAAAGTAPFIVPTVAFTDAGSSGCDNHILLAHQAGVGTGDLSKIEVRGLTLAQAIEYAKG